MKKIKSILIVLFAFLVLASVYRVVTVIAYSQGHYADSDISHDRYKSSLEEDAQQENQLPIKKWLMLFGTLSGFALLLLIIFEIGGGGLLPDNIEDLIAKICVGIIAIALWLYLYYVSSKIIFILLIPITILFILYIYLKPIFKDLYNKNFGKPSSPDYWICRKCGMENSNLMTECDSCSSAKSPVAEVLFEEIWICGNCDYKNPIRDKSCSKCGTRKDGQ